MVSGPKPVQIVSSVSVKNVKIAGTMLFTWVSTVGTRMICSETGRRHLSPAAHSTMPIENRFYLEEAECQQFDEFIRDLLQTVGTMSVILALRRFYNTRAASVVSALGQRNLR